MNKFQYKFTNLLGTVFKQGNLLFSNDGNTVFSPVGNRITTFDLKRNQTVTFPVESHYNFTTLALSPDGYMLIAVDESGEAHIISMNSKTTIRKIRFNRRVRDVKFSPDGKLFAVCKENRVYVYNVPDVSTCQFNTFSLKCIFKGCMDDTTCLAWSHDSQVLAIGSKDMTTKVCALNLGPLGFSTYTLGSHSNPIVSCFFENNSYDLVTISRDGQMCQWQCSADPKDLKNVEPTKKKKKVKDVNESEEHVNLNQVVESNNEELSEALKEININSEEKEETNERFHYKRLGRYYLADELQKEKEKGTLTAAAYHPKLKLLVVGFSTGVFFIYELPDVLLIHSLSVSNQVVHSIGINNTGQWIALGCGGLGQLLVWEWESETYVLKQQGHATNMSCLAYSSDGQYLATGGQDGKLKLWNLHSGFCFVTFEEHTSGITSVAFSGVKRFVVSCSLDGTVRAYDLMRYRNFRVFTTPRPVQLSCVSVDNSGEFVAAGGRDVFEIFLWSTKTGRLLEILAGHEGPIADLTFSSSITSTVLASVSWDKSLRIWNAIEKGSDHETILLNADALCVAFKPNGKEVAVGTLDGHISIFDVKTAVQLKCIEGRNDLGSGVSDTNLIGAKTILKSKAFTSICYSADGKCLLAGGKSKYVCIYSVDEGELMKKFEITKNRSLDGVYDFLNKRKMTEFGNFNLIEKRDELEGGNVKIKLPGVKEGDFAARSFKPEINVSSLRFSPTGQSWAAATTEGLLIYSLSGGVVFDPWGLQLNITPASIRKTIQDGDFLNAIVMSMRLNESQLIQETLEHVPKSEVPSIVSELHVEYVKRLLAVVSELLEITPHSEFYLVWIGAMLKAYGTKINWKLHLPTLLSIEKINRKMGELTKLRNFNTHTIEVLLEGYPEKDDNEGSEVEFFVGRDTS